MARILAFYRIIGIAYIGELTAVARDWGTGEAH